MTDSAHPTALISYSHDSPEHEAHVLELCNRLRACGIDTTCDQFLPGAPSEGWPLWMERQIESRDFTLIVCTEAYRRRFMEDEASGAGRGVVWEARILRNLLYEDSERRGRIVSVLLDPSARAFVPTVFRDNFYEVSDERGFENLLRYLLREPGAEAAPLGPLGPQGARWSAFERRWLVPDALRTPYFTGREDLLASLRAQLLERNRVALSGLGGVGKTQAALEYARRHREDYSDGVFWVNAETTSSLTSGFVEIAKTLHLTAAVSSDQTQVAQAALEWLNGTDRWLLILDNVGDRHDIQPFIPARGNGHVLITSRESVFQELGIARGLEVVDFDGDEGVRFLLRRTGRDDREQAAATQLAKELGNLPLALEQAAAYITETNARFSDYLAAFRKRRIALLEKARGLVSHDTVAVTWAANFSAVEAISPAAADVLRVSAFLAPDAIPFEIFSTGAQALGNSIAEALADPEDPLAFDELLRPLARYSLIRFDVWSRVCGMHRLVQEIVRASLAESERRTWIVRAASALNAAFPEVEYATWAQCDRLVPHAVRIAGWIDSYDGHLGGAARLLNEAGDYLAQHRGQYAEAEPLLERALDIRERALGPDHEDVAVSLRSLARLYWHQGRYTQAKPLFERALAIFERALGPDHTQVARTLSALAAVYLYQARPAEAEPLFAHALAIRERALGPDHRDLASYVEGFAAAHFNQGRFAEAQPLLERAMAIRERALGADHPDVAHSVHNLGIAHREQGRYAAAQPLLQRTLAIQERALGPDHPDVADSLRDLAIVYYKRGRYAEAEPLCERALAIAERTVVPNHPRVVACLEAIAEVYREQGRFAEAQTLFERALAILERAFDADHLFVGHALDGLANVFSKQGRYAEAEPLYERALAICEDQPYHPRAAECLVGLALLRKHQGRSAEAVALFERALAIKVRIGFAADHSELVEIRENLDALRAAIASGAASSVDNMP